MEIIFVIYNSVVFFSFLDAIILWTFLNIQKIQIYSLNFHAAARS